MHSIADMGGMQGYGPIERDSGERGFKADWEGTTFAVNVLSLAGGCFNIDESRHCMEKMSPVEYLGTSYYEHWLHSLEEILISKGIFSRAEYEAKLAELAGSKE